MIIVMITWIATYYGLMIIRIPLYYVIGDVKIIDSKKQ